MIKSYYATTSSTGDGPHLIDTCQLRTRRALMPFKDVLLRTRRALYPTGGYRNCEKGGPGESNAAISRQARKSRSVEGGGGGGTPTHFFFFFFFLLLFFFFLRHYGVGVPSTCQTDLRGEKPKKKKKKNAPKNGGTRPIRPTDI